MNGKTLKGAGMVVRCTNGFLCIGDRKSVMIPPIPEGFTGFKTDVPGALKKHGWKIVDKKQGLWVCGGCAPQEVEDLGDPKPLDNT